MADTPLVGKPLLPKNMIEKQSIDAQVKLTNYQFEKYQIYNIEPIILNSENETNIQCNTIWRFEEEKLICNFRQTNLMS